MQVKKFEAPTIQEALDLVKRELGPEAIILQTKKNRRGFGLLSKASVEVTAAISERSIEKKQYVESRVAETTREAISKLPAEKQANILNKYNDRRVATKTAPTYSKEDPSRPTKITATRYADIDDDEREVVGSRRPVPPPTRQQVSYGESVGASSVGGYLQNGSPARTRAPEPLRESVSRESKEQEFRGALPNDETSSPREKAFRDRMPQKSPSAQRLERSERSLTEIALEAELKELRLAVEEMRNAKEVREGNSLLLDSVALDQPALQDLFERLVVAGMDRRYAYALVKKCVFDLGAERCRDSEVLTDYVANEMMDTIEVKAPLDGQSTGPRTCALVGPTGVGKTATVAKIAGRLKSKGVKVGLINLAMDREASFDQLGTYAKALSIPFRSISTQDDLDAALYDFRTMGVILIDTPGRSFHDLQPLQEIRGILSGVEGLETYLTLSVTTRDSEVYDAISRFGIYRPSALVFTKLDETKVHGVIYNAQQKANLPLVYFTTGQKIPDDLEEALAERVVSLVLRI